MVSFYLCRRLSEPSFSCSGDKSNHIPTLHIPQIYYFTTFTTFFGWPVLLSYETGPLGLAKDVFNRMFGGVKCVLIVLRDVNTDFRCRRALISVLIIGVMAYTVKHFTSVSFIMIERANG